jgi:hypothetical protein
MARTRTRRWCKKNLVSILRCMLNKSGDKAGQLSCGHCNNQVTYHQASTTLTIPLPSTSAVSCTPVSQLPLQPPRGRPVSAAPPLKEAPTHLPNFSFGSSYFRICWTWSRKDIGPSDHILQCGIPLTLNSPHQALFPNEHAAHINYGLHAQ